MKNFIILQNLRILVSNDVENCIQYYKNFKSQNSSSNYKQYYQVYSLIEHTQDPNDYSLFSIRMIAFLCERYSLQLNLDDVIILQKLIIKHFQKIQVNVIAIHSLELTKSSLIKDMVQVCEKEIGCGLFFNLSFNKSQVSAKYFLLFQC